ncbi:hypothetical protein FHS61_001718 [Altererythrobacter atlanticus]|uniref:hypothetical protein n=1 Tax=Croceibacterium atlanticum TaxID=1267766 RepID=UPI0017EFFE2B|nr:hypothetical protein [Croceibacterium atlanticum]MBB5732709.1 hypothetical protein [Croceibacterium atlanticum]
MKAREGDLFACHIAFEGVSILYGERFLGKMKSCFQWKESYQEEREMALAILSLTSRSDWAYNEEIRRRFFWAVRTLALTILGDRRVIDFSLESINSALKRSDIDSLFQRRENASFDECKILAEDILQEFDWYNDMDIADLTKHLLDLGGIGLNTVKLVETHQAIDVGSLPAYI